MSKKITLLIMSMLFTLMLSAQNVSTLTEGSFSDGLALDSQGVLYGSDWNGKTVYKYNTLGVVSVFKNGFSNPNGIGINPSDEIYICDHTANKIYKYDTNGVLLQEFTGVFTTPSGIKNIPNSSDMLVVEYGENKIKRLDANGTVTTLFDGGPLNGPAGITFINDIPYIANYNDRKIFRFENGSLTQIAQLPVDGGSSFLGFMSNLDGFLIATHLGGHKIFKIDPTNGDVSVYAGTVAGDDDGDISSATYTFPNGILGDQTNGRIYISEFASRNLRIIEGAVLSFKAIDAPSIEVVVYPNPNKDSLNVKLNGFVGNEIQLSVFDLNGKEVFKEKYGNLENCQEKKIQTSHWKKGIYMLEVQSGQKTLTKKILVD